MPKRWTDTDKWNKKWLRQLEGRYRSFWCFLCDSCNIAGIWDVDFEVASIKIGFELKEDDTLKAFKDKVVVFDEGRKWFVPSFIDFQQGEVLNLENNCHKGIIRCLYDQKLFEYLDQHTREGSAKIGKILGKDKEALPKPFGSPSDGVLSPTSNSNGNGKGNGKGERESKEREKREKAVTAEDRAKVAGLVDLCKRSIYFAKVATTEPELYFCKMIEAYNLTPNIITKELKKMEAWLVSHPKRHVKDPKRFINNWLSRTGEDYGESGSDNSSSGNKPEKRGKFSDVTETVV